LDRRLAHLATAALVGVLIGAGSAAGLRSLSLHRVLRDSRSGTRGAVRARRAAARCGADRSLRQLLVGAGLLLASCNLLRVDPG
jgi:hypothetical protein